MYCQKKRTRGRDLSKGDAMKILIMLIVCYLWWCVPTHVDALTVEEILLLKQNGVSEQTIRIMLQSEIQAGRETPSGGKVGVRTITRPGGQSAIVYDTGSADHDTRKAEERLKEERAWEMLRHIIVDTRQTKDR